MGENKQNMAILGQKQGILGQKQGKSLKSGLIFGTLWDITGTLGQKGISRALR